ncbi:MAG: hypothetical protein ACREDR_43130 [Blastocatellia bacterium]
MKTRFLFFAIVLVVFLPAFHISRNANPPNNTGYVALADDGGSHGSAQNCPCAAQTAPSPQARIQPDRNKQPLPNPNGPSSESVAALELMAIVAGFLLWIRRL